MRLVDSRPSTPTPSEKVRKSLDSQSVTSFHIRALSQANVDDAVVEITKAVELHAPSEIIPATYLDKFSQLELDDIKSLSCDEVDITIGNVQFNVNESQSCLSLYEWMGES